LNKNTSTEEVRKTTRMDEEEEMKDQ